MYGSVRGVPGNRYPYRVKLTGWNHTITSVKMPCLLPYNGVFGIKMGNIQINCGGSRTNRVVSRIFRTFVSFFYLTQKSIPLRQARLTALIFDEFFEFI
jgi:hypothetical protein